MLGGLFGGKNKPSQRFPRSYNLTDFGVTADVTLLPSVWNDVGTVTVPAQQEVTFGATDVINGGQTGRPVYIRSDEDVGASGTAIEGKYRLALTNANETNTVIVMEERSERLRADQDDRQKAVLLPEFPRTVGEDSKLKVYFYIDSASSKTLDYNGTNTKWIIPVTVYQ